jgi:hypothetical protein
MMYHPDRPGGSKQHFQRLESAMSVMRDVSGGAPSRTDDSSSDSDDDDRESDPYGASPQAGDEYDFSSLIDYQIRFGYYGPTETYNCFDDYMMFHYDSKQFR